MTLLQETLAMPNLRRAWENVAENGGIPGVNNITIARWRRNWEERLVEMARAVRANQYQPAPLRRRRISKSQPGQYRTLRIPIVAAKVQNQRTLALRLARRRPHLDNSALPKLKQSLRQAQQAETLAALLGIEGQSARLYFHLYRQAFSQKWLFTRRNRRPPKDPINALLSLGYTFLSHAIIAALEVVGLDPFLGYFHTEKYNRPALALDLMEEFRAPIVDSLVLSLINRRQLRPTDFEKDPATGGVILSDRGLRLFLRQFSARLESEFKHRELGRAISYRKLFEVQSRRIARVVLGQDEAYRPFRAR